MDLVFVPTRGQVKQDSLRDVHLVFVSRRVEAGTCEDDHARFQNNALPRNPAVSCNSPFQGLKIFCLHRSLRFSLSQSELGPAALDDEIVNK
jgi:hypothetical protein